MANLTSKQRLRRRHFHIRKRLYGTDEKPRLLVRKSLKHMEASLINDLTGETLLTLTTKAGSFSAVKKETKTEQASRLGKLLADKAREKGIEQAVFDRGGHPYHGRVRALAENAREAGLRL
ncbi:MAG: 50S ribosomal protein L18 [Candidatus Fermentibacteraceae bacterium]|nr:50S ribosomal protein L18 [Candidatus Fermentibacteraceae bacterium]